MTHARTQHPNAVLTPTGRARMVACVLEDGWTIEATAERFQVDAKTVRKWRDRYRAEGWLAGRDGGGGWVFRTTYRHPLLMRLPGVILVLVGIALVVLSGR